MSARARALTGLILLGISIALFFVAMLRVLVGDWDMGIYLTVISFMLMLASAFIAATATSAAFVPIRVFKVRTEITCPSCGLKETRPFEKGDYIFKPAEECPRCGKERYISSIFREEEAEKPKAPQEEL